MNETVAQTLLIPFPATMTPPWNAAIERWYQLDAYAFSLVEAFHQLDLKRERQPSAMILACPLGSAETDCSFAQTGADSPTKFVHTLPNVRSAPLCQIMNWMGPVLCIQKDPDTWETAVQEARQWASAGEGPIWIWSVRELQGKYEVRWQSIFTTS